MEKCFICFGRKPDPGLEENDHQDQDDKASSSSSSVTLSTEEIDYEKAICSKVLLKLLYLPEIPFELLLKNDCVIICNNCKKRLMVVDHILNELEVLQGKIVLARRIIEKDLLLSYHQNEDEAKNLRLRPTGHIDVNSTCGVRKFICDLMHGLSKPVLDGSILGSIPVVKKQPLNTAKKRKLEEIQDYLDLEDFIEEDKLRALERDQMNPIENVTVVDEDYESILDNISGESNTAPSRLGRPTNINYGGIVQNINSTVRLAAPNGYISPSLSYRVVKDPINNINGLGTKIFNPQHLREKLLLQQSIQSQRPRSPMPVKEPSILLDKDAFRNLIVDDAKEKKLKLHIHISSLLPIIPREVKTVNMVSNEKVNKFLTNENIKLHILQNERDLIHRTCRVCSRVFQTKTKCESHVNLMHLGIEERQFECKYPNCTRKFKQQFLLNQHVRVIHLGAGFKCTVENCSKVLSTRRSQIKHSEKCLLASVGQVQPKINYQPSSNYVQQFQPALPSIHYIHQINPPSATTIKNLVQVYLPDNNNIGGDRNLPEELPNDPLAL